MKKITLSLLLFLGLINFGFSQNKQGDKYVFGKKVENLTPSGHIRCATTEYEEYLRSIDPKRATQDQFESWLAPLIEKQKQLDLVSSQSGGIVYIPVVVHVIHNGDAYGVNENITDEQVQSQITVMTQDFRRMAGTPGFNSNPVGADTQVEFVLAKVDPNGNPTNGINRVNLCKDSWSTTDINTTVKPSTIWDPNLYMNMWSVNFSDGTLLGYAQFPDASGLAGLNPTGGSANTDGVVAGYRFFGSSDLATGNFAAPYDKGRTMTHEVGHYLGLRHIWGDNSTCPDTNTNDDKDYCADTPAAAASNGACTTIIDSCPANPGNDMVENYMDYTNDVCMNIFTNDQKTRITTVLNNSPRRATLKTSTKDIAIALFANDAEIFIENSCVGSTPATCSSPNSPLQNKTVLLYNRGTAALTSATLNYNINGGPNMIHNWSGSLASNKYATISLTGTNVNGTLNVNITSVNGGSDQRVSNNSKSKAFSDTPPTVPYYNYTTYTFHLVGDRYGSETSWDLKDAAGTILYSGGPYTNRPTNGTQILVNNQTWNLPANGCYYLTVSDSYGDGINSGYGAGYYRITTNGGVTTVINNTTFASESATNYFTNNATLSTDDFQLLNGVTLYPNPSKDYFTIDLPQEIERKGAIEVYNNLGQKVLNKSINNDADLKVNATNFSNGVYFINLTIGGGSKTIKFIKE